MSQMAAEFSLPSIGTGQFESRISWVESLFNVVVLLLLSGALLPVYTRQYPGEVDVDSSLPEPLVIQLLFPVAFLIGAFFHVRRTAQAGVLPIGSPVPWIITALALVSTLWSSSPYGTFVGALSLVGSTFYGTYLGERFTARQRLVLISYALLTAAVLSAMAVLATPAIGQSDIGIRGVFNHKNTLGGIMVLAAVASWLTPADGAVRLRFRLGSALSVLLVLLSGSRNAQLALLVTVIVIGVIIGLRRWPQSITSGSFMLLPAALVGGLWLSPNIEMAENLFGRDTTLTGRTEIWQVVLEAGREKPWLGYGYQAFWRGVGSPAEMVWDKVSWHPNSPHSGYLSLWLDLGIIALILVLLSLLWTFSFFVRHAARERSVVFYWPIAFIALWSFLNLADFQLVAHNDIYWVIFVSVLGNSARMSKNATQSWESRKP